MTYFLRDNKNNTIIETECWIEREDGGGGFKFSEISSALNIVYYSKFLVENKNNASNVVSIIDSIYELRGWLWEFYFMNKNNNGNEKDHDLINEHIKDMYVNAARILHLNFVSD